LPVLLEQRDQKVDRGNGVHDNVVPFHVDVADGDAEGEDLLHLELDGLLDVVDLVGHRVVVGEETRELAGLVQARAQDTWDLLDERLRCQKCIERGGELLDKLFVLVKLLQVLDRLVRNAFLLANINVLGIGNDADLHVWSWDERELDGARETLVLGGVVSLKHDLQLDRLLEFSLLLIQRVFQDVVHLFGVLITGDFRHVYMLFLPR